MSSMLKTFEAQM